MSAKALPILFTGAMVNAILRRDKRQTRRLVAPKAKRLWVKETWRPSVAHSHGGGECDCGDVTVRYASDGSERYFAAEEVPYEWNMPKAAARGNVSPLFMPRWASRLTLYVIGERAEPLHNITEADAWREGIRFEGRWCTNGRTLPGGSIPILYRTWRGAFVDLWDSIHGAGAWDANPTVHVIDFGVEEAEA